MCPEKTSPNKTVELSENSCALSGSRTTNQTVSFWMRTFRNSFGPCDHIIYSKYSYTGILELRLRDLFFGIPLCSQGGPSPSIPRPHSEIFPFFSQSIELYLRTTSSKVAIQSSSKHQGDTYRPWIKHHQHAHGTQGHAKPTVFQQVSVEL